MRVKVNLSQRTKIIEKIALHLKCTLARPPIYDRSYPEKLATDPGNPVAVKKPSLFLLLVQQDKKSLEESTSFKGTYFSTLFSNKCMRNVLSEAELASKATVVHIA